MTRLLLQGRGQRRKVAEYRPVLVMNFERMLLLDLKAALSKPIDQGIFINLLKMPVSQDSDESRTQSRETRSHSLKDFHRAHFLF